ncbi:MAG: hemolysin family protein [Actinomycetota bacterium]
MNETDALLAGILVVLLVTAAVLGAAEAALLRVPRVRVAVGAEEGDRRSVHLLQLLDDLPRVLNTVLLTVLLVQIGAATTTGVFMGRHFGNVGVTIASIILTIVLFVYAEAIPKTYAVHHPDAVARATTPLLSGLAWLFHPVVTVLVAFADVQAPGRGVAGPVGVTEEELRLLASEAATHGAIDETDRTLMERAFELGDRTVEEILTPRTDLDAVPADATIADALDVAISSGHRRLPVYEDDLDHIRGVVRLRDLAAAVTETADAPVSSLASKELVVPETKRVVELLAEMQGTGIHLAVAIDEHGGTAGIVTIEDVAGELVGRISDEGEALRPEILRVGPDRWRLDATADVEDLEDETGVTLTDGDWITVGGLVTGVAGRIPTRGDVFYFEGLTITVLDALPQRVVVLEAVLAGHDSTA